MKFTCQLFDALSIATHVSMHLTGTPMRNMGRWPSEKGAWRLETFDDGGAKIALLDQPIVIDGGVCVVVGKGKTNRCWGALGDKYALRLVICHPIQKADVVAYMLTGQSR